MHKTSRGPATHSQQLERWLGAAEVESLSAKMRDFYWPVPVDGVPGNVYAMPGGDFAGPIEAGYEASAVDRAQDVVRKYRNEQRARIAQQHIYAHPVLSRQMETRRHSIANLAALIQNQLTGKGQKLVFIKSRVSQGASNTGGGRDAWYLDGVPSAGSRGAAAPGGTAHVNTDTGALAFKNPSSANTSYLIGANAAIDTKVNQSLLIYDRLFSVAKATGTGTEAVTGTFSRYQNQTNTARDYIGGNFVYPVAATTAAIGSAAIWTVCQYTNQSGVTGQSIPSITGTTGALGEGDINMVTAGSAMWFMPLASGDVGVKALTQIQTSVSAGTAMDFAVGHPLAWLASPLISVMSYVDGINTAFNFASVFDNACISFIRFVESASATITTSGAITVVSE